MRMTHSGIFDPWRPQLERRIVAARRLRIITYSAGMVGLGHFRRSLLVARALVGSSLQPSVLMIGGSGEATAFDVPEGVDCLALPAIRKDPAGARRPRQLDIPLDDLVALRSSTIRSAVEAFEPDVLLVDHLPWGAGHELRDTLELIRTLGLTRVVLGLRDVLNDPETVRVDWGRADNETAIREFYSAIWIYGDPRVYDVGKECGFPREIRRKIRFLGYLDQRAHLGSVPPEAVDPLALLNLPPGPLILCLVGGGDDGGPVAEAFARAALPAGANGVIVAGPYMSARALCELQRLAAARPRMRVVRFSPDPIALLERADRVVAMGGYNTVGEILCFDKDALIVPRATRRREQTIRAERLRDLGLIDLLDPNCLTAGALSDWLARPRAPRPRARDVMDFGGLTRLPQLLNDLLSLSAPVDELGTDACHVAE